MALVAPWLATLNGTSEYTIRAGKEWLQQHRLIVHVHGRGQVGVQLVGGLQVICQPVDHHGGLFRGTPPVAFIAMIHQPLRGFRQQIARALLVRQKLDAVGRGFGRHVSREIQHGVARGWPPSLISLLLRTLRERRSDLRCASVLGRLEG